MRASGSGGRDDAAIETATRLAVLLGAGLSGPTAWRHLAVQGDALVVDAARVAEAGGDVAGVLRSGEGAWGDIAAAWSVATAVGAPLAESLRSAVTALRDAREVKAEIAVALAEPVATARLLTLLPVLGLPLGSLLGLDPLRVVAEPLGACALLAGLVLLAASVIWTRHLARRARPDDGIPGWDAELVAMALASGASIERAWALSAAARGADAEPTAGIATALELSARAGAPAVELLRGEAWLARHRARATGREAAARLSTRLLVPLGVCTLPAFLLLAVVPAVLGVVRSTSLPL